MGKTVDDEEEEGEGNTSQPVPRLAHQPGTPARSVLCHMLLRKMQTTVSYFLFARACILKPSSWLAGWLASVDVLCFLIHGPS